MRIMVTGGAGFIGSRVVARLLVAGHEVHVIDDLSRGRAMPPEAPGLGTHRLDIRDRGGMTSLFSTVRPQALLHLAAVHHIPTCETERSYALDVNVVGTEVALMAAEAAGTDLVVLASSGAVYDPATTGALVEDMTPVAPADNYALAKLANERQAAFWSRRTGRSVRIARIFNTIGRNDPNAHLIPDILAQLGTPPRSTTIRLGNIQPRRDFVHADDVADALVRMVLDPARDGGVETCNICSGEEWSVTELVGTIADVLGIDIAWEQDASRVRPVDRVSQLGSPGKMMARFGWRPTRDFRSAVAATVGAEAADPTDGGARD